MDLELTPAMMRVVDLVNASQEELNDVQLRHTRQQYQVCFMPCRFVSRSHMTSHLTAAQD